MPAKISPPSCSSHRPVNWYRPRDKHLRTRYAVRSGATKHIDQLKVDESQLAEARSRDYVQAFARLLTNEDKAVLRQAKVVADDRPTIEQRFRKLADDWSRETMHISSASDLIKDKNYQEIIGLGWDVVPYLLADLKSNKRFWFPALAAITGVRPFDKGDSNNPRRMTEAWTRWGKWKGLI